MRLSVCVIGELQMPNPLVPSAFHRRVADGSDAGPVLAMTVSCGVNSSDRRGSASVFVAIGPSGRSIRLPAFPFGRPIRATARRTTSRMSLQLVFFG